MTGKFNIHSKTVIIFLLGLISAVFIAIRHGIGGGPIFLLFVILCSFLANIWIRKSHRT